MKNCYILIMLVAAFCFMSQGALAQTYVGPEKCLQCHSGAFVTDASGWRTSMHANGYSDVTDNSKTMENHFGIICDANQNGIDDFIDGLDFNTISSAFDPFKPNAPILAYSANDGYTITIGDVTSRVYLTYGGSGLYKQRYAMKIPDGTGTESADWYISPVQYNEKTHEYVLYHADDYWVFDNGVPTNVPVFTSTSTLADISTNSRSFTKGCSGCHVTGMVINPKDANGEWTMSGGAIDPTTEGMYTNNNTFDLDGDGVKEQMNTGCERCHGPGGDHVTSLSKDDIINPATDLTPEQATNMCGMCHSRGKSLPNNTFSFAYDDLNMEDWAIGDLVDDYYTDGGGYYGDNDPISPIRSSRQHHQQFRDFTESNKPTFQFHNVTCYECHDVHNTVKHHIREEIIEEDSTGAEIVVATDNDDNTLCLACHATFGAFADIPVEWVADYDNHINDIAPIVSAHTKHQYDPTGTGASRCSKCHNPKTIKSAINYDIHSHTFEVISPEKTKLFNMPNACAASCHVKDTFPNFGIDVSGDDLGTWNEASDIALADTLLHYYGPGGIWWNTGFPLAVEDVVAGVPSTYMLEQNYPNPFNPSTKISFEIPDAGFVKMNLYNILGQKVATLVNTSLLAGRYVIDFNGSFLSSGIYIYKLEANSQVVSKKMVLTK